ncbi:conserved hypothetical protein [Listeria innocua FSL S4-378]|nr:conserved hypothetical protein [Listeria innocua FSL S4-378]
MLYPFNYMGFEMQTTEISLPEINMKSKINKHLKKRIECLFKCL